jgi:mannose-6-phosphate isomerase-like protein (cupin superfamily)
MKVIRGKRFTGARPWEALDVARLNGITVRLHWTDQPYRWHVNDGEEVFVVLDGCVEMRYRISGIETSTLLEAGDIFHATVGTEHVAHPLGEARILVVETEGSV